MSYASEVLADSPLAYYRLGEASGLTLVDSSGNGRNGTYNATGITYGVTGALTASLDTNTAVSGSVTSANATVTNAAWMNGLTAVTCEVWVKGGTVIQRGIGMGSGSTGPWYITTNSSRPEFRVNTSAGAFAATGTTLINDDVWHHVVGTWDGSNVRVYLDGVLEATTPTTGTPGATTPTLYVANRANSGASSYDEAAVYGTALSGARIAAHYAAATTPSGPDLTVAGTLPMPTGTFQVTVAAPPRTLTLAGTLPMPTGGFALTAQEPAPPSETNLAGVDGRRRGGYGVATWDPPVVPAPVTIAAAHAFVKAETYESVTMDGTRPVIVGHTITQRRRHRDRIVVGGRDITYWRGVTTPLPSYGLIEPLLHGSGSLELPQVAACYETPGEGALSWLKAGAAVEVQRVDAFDVVVATDYRAVILDFDVSGRNLRVGLGGHVAGRAALRDRQAPIFKRRYDLGRHWWADIREVNRPFHPHTGPTTGIELFTFGDIGLLDHMQQLSAKGANTAGAQWTCMPNDDGVYRVTRKDRETITGTVYLDAAHTVANLRRDIAEEPNRIFASGVTPQGRRVRFGVYPVLADTKRLPYPNGDDSNINPGDTDADTDTGGGVTAMLFRLARTGYLSVDDRPGGYDNDVVRAIRALQRDAGLNDTGTMNVATWRALFDVDVTGYNINGSHIEPAAQQGRVRQFLRTADGNILGPNPNWKPSTLVVDRTIAMGTGITRTQMREWALDELTPTPGDGGFSNWVGTITFHTGALIRDEHTPGDPVTTTDVLHSRALRPGQNLWLPLFDGGTLVHISGVDVNSDGVVTASVDTQARDTMKVWEVIQRNRDNRRDPARAWIRDHRSSTFAKDAVTEFDEIGGTIEAVDLDEGWNVFPVVAGQEGTIARLRMRTTPAEYVVAVFGRRITPGRLRSLVGNPLTEAGTKKWTNDNVRENLDQQILLYAVGTNEEPCGYFPASKPLPDEDDPDTVLLTGRFEDDAGFGYRTFDHSCVLWVAVYADRATTLAGGRIMWPQLEAGS